MLNIIISFFTTVLLLPSLLSLYWGIHLLFQLVCLHYYNNNQVTRNIYCKILRKARRLAEKENLNIYLNEADPNVAGSYRYLNKNVPKTVNCVAGEVLKASLSLSSVRGKDYDYPHIKLNANAKYPSGYSFIDFAWKILLHELGHHFLVNTEFNTEENADLFIIFFLLRELTTYEKWMLHCWIHAYVDAFIEDDLFKHYFKNKFNKEYKAKLEGLVPLKIKKDI